MICRKFGVSRSGYYQWRRRGVSERPRANDTLLREIEGIFHRSGGTYGSPRIHEVLKQREKVCGKKRVARLMGENHLKGRVARVYRRQPGLKRFYRLGNQWRGITLTGPDQVWVADIIHLRAGGQRFLMGLSQTVQIFPPGAPSRILPAGDRERSA